MRVYGLIRTSSVSGERSIFFIGLCTEHRALCLSHRAPFFGTDHRIYGRHIRQKIVDALAALAPALTRRDVRLLTVPRKSLHAALADLRLDRLLVVHPRTA